MDTDNQGADPLREYRLSQELVHSRGTYKSCVVVARSEDEARAIYSNTTDYYCYPMDYHTDWLCEDTVDLLLIEEQGLADPGAVEGTVKDVRYRREDDYTLGPLKVYLLSQAAVTEFDTFDSCVVLAFTEGGARVIHPELVNLERFVTYSNTWVAADQLHLIEVEELGLASTNQVAGTVKCASFNAG
jgi:hypothetical protein